MIYDYVFVTHLPAAYKVRLFQRLAERLNIFVIFIARGSILRPGDFTDVDWTFPHCVLFEGAFEQRPWIHTCWKIHRLARTLSYRNWVVGGWELPEFWISTVRRQRGHHGVWVESPWRPSTARWKQWPKRIFLRWVQAVWAAGSPQTDHVRRLGFTGAVHTLDSVGLLPPTWQRPSRTPRTVIQRFLYVGRFSEEKNLPLLLSVFRTHPHLSLTCVGDGPQGILLRQMAPPNVQWMPYQPNTQLSTIFAQHDVLILPSRQEAWGLVVEEALFHGLPVVVSSAVGCAVDRVATLGTGLVFTSEDSNACAKAIQQITTLAQYQKFQRAVSALDYATWQQTQLEAFH
ncbi:glycosyltransferase [bacterium]|nr:glycosyltransferase [bacterium]